MCSKGTQSKTFLDQNLQCVENVIHALYAGVQVKRVCWGLFKEGQSLEVSRNKTDIPPERDGPTTVVFLRISQAGIGEFVVSGNILDTFVGFTSRNTVSTNYRIIMFSAVDSVSPI